MNANPTRQAGAIGVILFWLLFLAGLTGFFVLITNWQHNPNQSLLSVVSEQGIAEVILKRNRMGHYVANGEINGQPVQFLLDTGATSISIPARVARRLGLKGTQKQWVETANGSISVTAIRLQQVRLGDIQLSNVPAHINPYMDDEDVLLGMTFLKHLEMIQRGDTLTLRAMERKSPGQKTK